MLVYVFRQGVRVLCTSWPTVENKTLVAFTTVPARCSGVQLARLYVVESLLGLFPSKCCLK